MKSSKQLLELSHSFGAKNYLPLPVVLAKAQGAWVWDVEGEKYLDFLSCYSALNFGHQNPHIVGAMKDQLEKIAVCSRAFESEQLCLFVDRLAQFCKMEAVLPMNSGTEAVETALKVARKWGYLKKSIPPNEANIIVMKNNFHGRSISVISFSSEPAYRDHFGPFTPGFREVPFNDLEAFKSMIDKNTAAVLAEPIQAEAGILIPSKGYLKGIREICCENDVLLMWDEIQTGLGRTGKNFCFQHEAAQPDILILGKSLGGGLLPISAVVTRREIMDVIGPGEHGSTFGGNPLACAVGRAAIDVLDHQNLALRSETLGEQVLKRLQTEVKSNAVKEVRGVGLLIGIELTRPARGYCEKLAKRGVLCKETHETVIRIAPPLTIPEKDLMWGVDHIIEVLNGPLC